MIDEEKKKINDKKYKRKNTIIAIVGVILIAILFITSIDVNAADYTDRLILYRDNLQSNIGAVTATYYYTQPINFTATSGSANWEVNLFIISANDGVSSQNVRILNSYNDLYYTTTKLTDNDNRVYNIYSCTGILKSITNINYHTSNFAEIYGFYFLSTESSNYSVYYNELFEICNELNKSDYISNIIEIEGNENHYIDEYTTNNSYIYDNELYTNSSSQLIIKGEIAISEGVVSYLLTVNGVQTNIDNMTSQATLSDNFVEYVNNSGLDITNYNSNGYFTIYINLSDYIDRVVSVSLSAVDSKGYHATILLIPIVHVYMPEIDTDTETETETETGGVEPPIDDSSDYDKGYNQALKDMLNGNLIGGELSFSLNRVNDATSSVTNYKFPIHGAPYSDANYFPPYGLTFEQIYNTWVADGGSIDTIVVNVHVTFNKPIFIKYNQVIIRLPDNLITDGEPNISIYALIVDNTTNGYKLGNVSYIKTGDPNEFVINFGNITDLVMGIELNGVMPATYQNVYLRFNQGNYAYNETSYNEGYNEGIKIGRQLGYIAGYSDGHKDGYANGYDDGLNSTNLFFQLFTGLFDTFLFFITSLLSFEILGINVLGFISGILTIIAVIWLIRRLFG